jgi:GAF domain-containing protein
LCPSGEAFETGKIVVLHDPFSDPRLKPWDDVRIIVGSLKTMVWVPLFKKGKVFGIFVLYSDIRREISDKELSILEQVGVMISIAITSNQYLDKLTQRTKELENEIAERKKAENKLQTMHDKLEIMVEERTSELSEANKKLQLFRDQINQSNDAIFVADPQTANSPYFRC